MPDAVQVATFHTFYAYYNLLCCFGTNLLRFPQTECVTQVYL